MTNTETLRTNDTREGFNITQLLPSHIITVVTTPRASKVLAYPPVSYAVLCAITNTRGLLLDAYRAESNMTLISGNNRSEVIGSEATIIYDLSDE